MIGRQRSYSFSQEKEINLKRTLFIKNRCKNVPKTINYRSHKSAASDISDSGSNNSAGAWAPGFETRPTETKPRNCIALPSNLKTFMLKTVFDKLLEMNSHKTVDPCTSKQICANVESEIRDSDSSSKTVFGGHTSDKDVSTWNKGGKLELSEVASLFDADTLQKLKNECGGLQTILRNCNQAFMGEILVYI